MMKCFFGGIISFLIKRVLCMLCAIDAEEVSKLPRNGPYLLVMNHVNFLEVPIMYLFLRPRRLYSLVKAETWDNFFLAFLADIWDAIPIRRGTADFSAFSAAERVFREGNMLIMAPEGTWSCTGILGRAHGGAAFLAVRNRVPVYPIAHSGGELFFRSIKRLKRTPFRIRVGEPFLVCTGASEKLDGALRREITREIMGRIAYLLPEAQRGGYADAALTAPRYIRDLTAEDAAHA